MRFLKREIFKHQMHNWKLKILIHQRFFPLQNQVFSIKFSAISVGTVRPLNLPSVPSSPCDGLRFFLSLSLSLETLEQIIMEQNLYIFLPTLFTNSLLNVPHATDLRSQPSRITDSRSTALKSLECIVSCWVNENKKRLFVFAVNFSYFFFLSFRVS